MLLSPTLNKQLFAGMSDSFENPSGDYSGDYYTFVEDSCENKTQKIDCLQKDRRAIYRVTTSDNEGQRVVILANFYFTK